MLTFNHSYDGGTFEEETAIQKFQRLIKLRGDAEWLVQVYYSLGLNDMAQRYYKLMNYIENKMLTINF